ncbi:hypothetical protein M408DRAFT_29758 [Serendipita vermifera MAFF 305830]|uniref:Lysine-specific metallo-endopeptidase domain-containing protein n=1 Tax=Serendipita vermifera MAFF 305830 TaxID=933852 RepID=A0A0C3APP2_SERVB|nr:hypothetical protein M408DRAFT_29758 [Serendipita vermifera MAFF 305830]
MYRSFLLSLILTVSLVVALPLSIRFDTPPTPAVQGNVGTVMAASITANTMIQKMQAALNAPTNQVNKARIEKAFGPHYNVAEIKKVVDRLQANVLLIRTADQTVLDTATKRPAATKVTYNRDSNNKIIASSPMKYAELGSRYYGMSLNEKAGALIHEATHYQSLTGDDTDSSGQIIPSASNTRPVGVRAGYAQTATGATITMDTIIADHGASLDNGPYNTLRQNARNMHQNADSYRVFAALVSI